MVKEQFQVSCFIQSKCRESLNVLVVYYITKITKIAKKLPRSYISIANLFS